MKLPDHKSKIVCTIGPSSRGPNEIREMIRAGMSAARLNFSHGSPAEHAETIRIIREEAARQNRPVPVLADLPGPKIRVGILSGGPIELKKGDDVVLAPSGAAGAGEIPVDYDRLHESVSRGGTIFLDDGRIRLRVLDSAAPRVFCRVVEGGLLQSRKGMNIPGSRLMPAAVTERDFQLIDFALDAGLSIFCVSFVSRSDDIVRVREYARKRGGRVFVIAKIERGEAVRNMREILDAADGIMVARGDLGMEIPIEDVPLVQKELIFEANLRGKPVITATQMLESMTSSIRPTRAEVTDVANAILDGTDAVMLSEETAVGRHPVEAVRIMSRIARKAERRRKDVPALEDIVRRGLEKRKRAAVGEAISLSIMQAIRILRVNYVLAPTHTGSTPRRISRFKPDCWILSFCADERIRLFLSLTCGVFPFPPPSGETDAGASHEEMAVFLKNEGLAGRGDRVVLARMTAPGVPGGLDSMGIITLV
ncbi:MAG: pyruvate kinase [Syntrophales bacterium]|jgi:pyruvate kinase|nr:pyruvate kinase [Syntrophales bacterium]MDD5232613.1 pyruvate kinase [Syntrophales bacterium]MDD5533473.1 pyruvate kinase [Syntrophales bacterium]HPL62171.1 pyruvate kinase [Syntrophales bacterium]